jgi:hypothetical protein
MEKDETSERMILQLRAVLRGISPLIWRRLLVLIASSSSRTILGRSDHPATRTKRKAGGSIPSLLTFIARPGRLPLLRVMETATVLRLKCRGPSLRMCRWA